MARREIDLVLQEAVVDPHHAAHLVVLGLQTEGVPVAEGKPHAAEENAAHVGALGHETVAERTERTETVEVAEVDEVAELRVAPGVEADSASEIGLDRRISERQEAQGRRARNDAEAEVLGDLAAVHVRVVVVHAGNRALVVPEAEADLEVVAQREVPRSAHRSAVEVVQPESEQVQVLEQHVAVDPAVVALDRELARVERDGLLRACRRGPQCERCGERRGGPGSPDVS